MARTRRLVLPLLAVGLLAMASARNSSPKVVGTRAPKPYSSRALRGLMSQKNDKLKKADDKRSLEPKKTPPATKAPMPEPLGLSPKVANKDSPTVNNVKGRQYNQYSYFVEACEEELISDVINGGIVEHSQYTNFIYGYCRGSDIEGRKCSKSDEEGGFDYLPNDIKLMYIKTFCPTDVEGQVSCLHGINERGREYEFHDELERMCQDLEKIMIKDDLLVESKKPEDPQEATDAVGQSEPPEVISSTGNGATPTYQTEFSPNQNIDAVEQVAADVVPATQSIVTPPTSRPTDWLFPEPTPSWGDDSVSTEVPSVSTNVSPPTQEVTWGSVTAVSPMGSTTDSSTGTSRTPGLAVTDEHGNNVNSYAASSGNNKGQGGDGMSPGATTGVILLVLLGTVIAFTTLLVMRKHRRDGVHSRGIGRDFFFMKLQSLRPSDETETYDKTLVENNGSIASEEIDFNGPLFESWPMTQDDLNKECSPHSPRSPHNHDSDALRQSDDDEQDQSPTDFSPSTYTSSLLSSFFSKVAVGSEEPLPADSAVDEIKRAINEGLWQDVYYLASKMAAEGNIDTDEKLQSALVRSNENGGDYVQVKTRGHLKPEDAARAAQLDVSLVAGDWITLAARAAVFAALDAANNPVPSSISFVPLGKQTVDECLQKATTALKEARKAAKAKERMQQQALALTKAEEEEYESTSAPEEEKLVFINADEGTDDSDFEYPKEDYSDFSRTGSSDETHPERNDIPAPPSLQAPPPLVENVVDDESSDDESVTSGNRSDIPGPPSIAMSNQSTIPTQQSTSKEIPFQSISDGARGPFVRDFLNGVSRPMEQEDETEPPMDLSRAIQ